MKMQELIDGISKIYREQLEKKNELYKELIAIENELFKADLTSISFARYNYLTERLETIKDEINTLNHYCDGISCVREYCMNLGFDTPLSHH